MAKRLANAACESRLQRKVVDSLLGAGLAVSLGVPSFEKTAS
jgi:hypothetical protein